MTDPIERADAIKLVDSYIGTDPIVEKLKDIPSAENKGEWIPCSERLPEANEQDEQGFYKAYLVQRGRRMYTARWDGMYWVLWTVGTVLEGIVAWMPLPEPWEGADDDDKYNSEINSNFMRSNVVNNGRIL